MKVRHGLAVHLEREHRVRLHRLRDGMAPDEVWRLGRRRSVVPVGDDVERRRPGSGQTEHVREPDPAPHRRPDGPVLPLEARRRGLVEAPPVSGALERDRLGHHLHALEVVEAQRQRVLDLAIHGEDVRRRVDDRAVVVVPDEEDLGGRDVGGQLPERRLQVDGPRAPDDQLFLARHRGRRLSVRGQPGAEQRRRGSDLDDERAPGDGLPSTCERLLFHGVPQLTPPREVMPREGRSRAAASRNARTRAAFVPRSPPPIRESERTSTRVPVPARGPGRRRRP